MKDIQFAGLWAEKLKVAPSGSDKCFGKYTSLYLLSISWWTSPKISRMKGRILIGIDDMSTSIAK